MYGDEVVISRDLPSWRWMSVGGLMHRSIYDMNLAKSYFFLNQHWHVLEIPLSPFHPPSLPSFFVSINSPFPLFLDSKHRHRNVHLRQPRKAARLATPPNHQPHHHHNQASPPHSPTLLTRWHRTAATLKATSLILTNILVITTVATQLCILGLTPLGGGAGL